MNNFEKIPDELKQLKQWVLTEKDTKEPYPVAGNRKKRASCNNAKDWNSFDNAVTALNNRFCGIAFAITEPFAIIDLDDQCINGNLSDIARDIIDRLNSYTEKSMSENGIHIIVKTGDNDISIFRKSIEIYSRSKFITLTGDIFEGRDTIKERESELLSIIQDYHLIKEPEPTQTNFQPINEHTNKDIDFIYDIELQKALSQAIVGNRHNTGMDFACQLRDNRIPFNRAEDAMRQYQAGVPQGDKPYPISEALKTLKSVYNDPPRQPSYQQGYNPGGNHTNINKSSKAGDLIAETSYQMPEFNLTEYGNAERLAYHHSDNIKYCYQQKKWYIWEGNRWAEDISGNIQNFAKSTVRLIYKEASECQDSEIRKAIVNHAKQSESSYKQEAMIKLAQSESGIPVKFSQLDADPWLLNCINGVIDLRTGELSKHHRDYLITKMIPVEYNPNAKLDLWETFLETSTKGNEHLKAFLQYAAGYSLTGDTSEEKLFFIHGPGASGKSTFIEALKSVLGEYSKTADFETFLSRSFVGGIRNDIAELAGARLVSSIEVDEGKKLAEGLVKLITGGDTVRARFLFQESFEFMPQFKLWLVANHKPDINPDDTAMWRRILVIPFRHVIPENERDPQVKAILKNPSVAGPAILAWAVQGCLRWQEYGLMVPDVVKQETESYKQEMDPLKQYLDDCCIINDSAIFPCKEFTEHFNNWLLDNFSGREAKNKSKGFSSKLKSMRFEQKPTRIGDVVTRAWVGFGLKKDDIT